MFVEFVRGGRVRRACFIRNSVTRVQTTPSRTATAKKRGDRSPSSPETTASKKAKPNDDPMGVLLTMVGLLVSACKAEALIVSQSTKQLQGRGLSTTKYPMVYENALLRLNAKWASSLALSKSDYRGIWNSFSKNGSGSWTACVLKTFSVESRMTDQALQAG
ncbi:hypothetical protein PPTG_22058 [Phytophthora nicotianae INRA-310]|uniref:Uncharacterized protein n=1 Tax=Phytophthora nicotianae (strain INRA-310) TaxID=761204 RepID=W2QRB1_PHYN3|nr:hypothetical protein PPTG_22058 [Phytophthora nicotianae INRA-310]ETN15044.1 hypothetical protein PPTG_22058 [Phytophthora nicotianae INRA-310]